METYLILLILAGMVAMDTTSGPQIFISEPIVSCSILGLLFGKPETGLIIGIFFQLFWLGYLPLGAVRLTDSNMAAFISSASLFTAAEIFGFTDRILVAGIIPALLFGIAAGFVGLHLTTAVRQRNGRQSEIFLSRLEKDSIQSVSGWHMAGIGLSFLRGFLMALILVPLGAAVCGLTVLAPDLLIDSITLSAPVIWGAACASAVMIFVLRGKIIPLILGAVGGFIWILRGII